MSIKGLASRYFVAAAGSAAISFVTLPLTTKILGPGDFGAVAIVAAIVGVGSAFATLGTSFVVYRFLPDADEREAAAILATLCWTGVGIALLWAGIAVAGFQALRSAMPSLTAVPSVGYGLAVGAMVLSPFWAVAMDVLTLEQRAGVFARALLAQALTTAAVTLTCLFALDLGTLALFAGNFAGTLVLFGCALWILGSRARPQIHLRWLRNIRAMAAANAGAQASETGYILAERFLLSRFAGLAELGLFTHAQRYRDVGYLGVKAVGRGAFPLSLQEARDPTSDFAATRNTWNAMYVLIAAAGVAAAAAGDVLLALLTNDKFTAAYVFLGPWFVYLLIQNAARPQFATIFALGEGKVVARANLISNLASLVLLALLVPWAGSSGAMIAALAQVTLNRLAVARASHRYRATPRHDQWVLIGIAAIIGTMLTKHWLEPSAPQSLLLAATGAAAVMWVGRRSLAPVIGGILGRRGTTEDGR